MASHHLIYPFSLINCSTILLVAILTISTISTVIDSSEIEQNEQILKKNNFVFKLADDNGGEERNSNNGEIDNVDISDNDDVDEDEDLDIESRLYYSNSFNPQRLNGSNNNENLLKQQPTEENGNSRTNQLTNGHTAIEFQTSTYNNNESYFTTSNKNEAPLNSCEFWLDPAGGNFTSFGYPDNYPHNLDCRYRIPNTLDSGSICQLELYFHDFDLSPSNNEFEPLKVVRKNSSSSNINNNNNKNDFQSHWIENEFELVESMKKSKSEECTDYLEFSNNQKRYCKNEWKNKFELAQLDPNDKEKDFIFRFVTDKTNCSKGFLIEYKPIKDSCGNLNGPIPEETKVNKKREAYGSKTSRYSDQDQYQVQMLASASDSMAGCEERHIEMEFEIKSVGFPYQNYSNNLDCVHYVQRGSNEVCGLEIRFIKFDLEQSEGCAYDFLEIDGESFCGRLPDGSRNIFRFDTADVKTISFQTDSQVGAPGFHIHVTQLTDCVNTFMPTDNQFMAHQNMRHQKCSFVGNQREGQMSSQKFPEPYPNDLLCAYTIEKSREQPGRDYCSVELTFDTFDIQNTPDCRSDFFEILNRRFCGKQLHEIRKVIPFNEDGFVKFLFKSDQIESENQGFLVNYTQVECLHNEIQQPSEATNVPERRVDGAENQPTTITTVTDKNPNQDTKFMDILTQETNPTEEPTSQQIQKKPKQPKPANQNQTYFYREPCYRTFNEKKFSLTTDLTNGTYKENLDCLYTIRKFSPKVCYLEMHFDRFDLEASADCMYDYMEIGNSVRLCGTLQQETSRIYRFDKPEMLITFHTDASTEREGFTIRTEQLECEGDRIIRDQEDSEDSTPAHLEEPKDNLQSLEQNKFESQFGANDSQQFILQQQENFLHPMSEFDHIHQQQQLQEPFRILTPQSVHCSKIFQEKEFFIHSPGFPDRYGTDLDCLYMIQPYSPSVCKVEINFDSFELQPYDFTKNCMKSDFFDIDGREQLCGKMAESQSKMYPFLNQTFLLHFHSDSFRTSFDKGFRVYVRQIDCGHSSGGAGGNGNFVTNFEPNLPPQSSTTKNAVGSLPRTISRCNKIYTTSSFVVKSPMYPTVYPSNSHCQYRVIKLRGDNLRICYLEVAFVDFNLQDSPNCSNDYVNFNGVKVCGKILKDSVRQFPFYGNEFIINFSSDRILNGRGFYLQVRQNECPSYSFGGSPGDSSALKRPIVPTSIGLGDGNIFSNLNIFQTNQQCQKTFNSIVFEIQSPNYPHYYLPNLACVYTVQRRHSRICKLELHFIDIDIEPSLRCNRDFLMVDGARYCNTNRPETIVQLPFYEQEKRIAFQTTAFRRRKGYLIQARQLDCDPFNSDDQQQFATPTPPAAAGAGGVGGSIIHSGKYIFLPSLPSICEICVTEVTGNLQSYDYPNYYPPNLNCTYRITPLPDNCMVQLRFEQFDFDSTLECDMDYLEINGIRYCGQQLKDVSMILLNKHKEDLSIRMVTNSRGAITKPSFRGFRASYTQLPCEGTGPEANGPSPSKSGYRPPSSPSSYRGQQPGSLPVIQRPLPDQPASTKSVGPQSNPPSRNLQIEPRRDPNLPIGNNISIIADDQQQQQQPIYCDQTFQSKVFNIKSPGFPYRYFDNLNCAYTIKKNNANVCRLKFTFNQFNVIGEDGRCRGDYLDVFQSRLCGILERYTTKEIPFFQDNMVLYFHTNNIRTANGFSLIVEQVDCLAFGESSTKATSKVTTPDSDNNGQTDKIQNSVTAATDDDTGLDSSKISLGPSGSDNININPFGPPPLTPSKDSMFRYDDDDTGSDYNGRRRKPDVPDRPTELLTSTTSYPSTPMTTTDRNDDGSSLSTKKPGSHTVDVKPQVVYESNRDDNQQRLNGDDDGSGFRPDSRLEFRPDIRPYSGQDTRPYSRPDSRPESRPYSRPDSRPDTRPSGFSRDDYQQPGQFSSDEYQKTDNNGYPLRYFSRNITVEVNGDISVGSDRFENPNGANRPGTIGEIAPKIFDPKQPTDQKPWNSVRSNDIGQSRIDVDESESNRRNRGGSRRGQSICDELLSEKMYFELKSKDLQQLKNGMATCQLQIKKAKSNICQLDIMFVRYNMNDTTCGQQYLSVDGERICGHVPESTIKKFWFIRPEMFLFVKMNRQNLENDRSFDIKVRQVECAGNVKDSQLPEQSSGSGNDPGQYDTMQTQTQNNIEQQLKVDNLPFNRDNNQYDRLQQSPVSQSRYEDSNYYPGNSNRRQHGRVEQVSNGPRSPTSNNNNNIPNVDSNPKTSYPDSRFKNVPQFEPRSMTTINNQQQQYPTKDGRYRDSGLNRGSRPTSVLSSPSISYRPTSSPSQPQPSSPSPLPQSSLPEPPSPQPPTKPLEYRLNEKGFDRYCDLIENDLQFKIVSPRESPAGTFHRCRYMIRKNNDKVCAIDIRFNMFRLQDDAGRCEQEFVEIDHGKICGAFPVGHERRYHFLPNEYEKMIYFTSNRTQMPSGDFSLEIKQIEDCDKPAGQKPSLSVPMICDQTSRNQRGHIKSPNYPAPYSDFTRCTYRVQSLGDQYCHLRLLIRDLDIEQGQQISKDCDKDLLEFYNVKLCGQEVRQREYMIPFEQINGQQVVQFKFSTDANGNGRGFDIEYNQELCNKQTETEDRRYQSPSTIKSGPSQSHRYSPSGRLRLPASPVKGSARIAASGRDSSSDSNTLSHNPMRPYYPPNYVSKAHLVKSMDRKQFIKMFMMMDEKEGRKIKIEPSTETVPNGAQLSSGDNNNEEDDDSKMLQTSTSTTSSSVMTTASSSMSPLSITTTMSSNGGAAITTTQQSPIFTTTTNNGMESLNLISTMSDENVDGDNNNNIESTTASDLDRLISTTTSATAINAAISE